MFELSAGLIGSLTWASKPDRPSVPDGHVDLVIDPGGVATPVQVKHRSLVTDDVARRLLDEASSDAVLLIVGDRVTEAARRHIASRHGGYLDLGGRLAIRTPAMLIDAEVRAFSACAGRADALSGKAGMEVAVALLMDPQLARGVRELARLLGRAAGTVSEVLAALRRGT